MKKFFHLPLTGLLALSLQSVGTAQVLYNPAKPVPFTLASISGTSDGGVSLTLINQRDAYHLNSQGIFIAGATTTKLNEYQTYTYNAAGESTGSDAAFYTPQGGTWQVGQLGMSEKFESRSLKEIQSKNPDLFAPRKRMRYTSEWVSVNSYEQSYLPMFLEYFGRDNLVAFQPRHPNYNVNKKLNTFSHQYMINSDKGLVTTFFGNNDLANKENKKNHLKDYDFITYNFNQEITEQFNVKFAYPRVFYYGITVYNEEDLSTAIGRLFIFSKATKKDGPDPSMFDLVYLSADGKLFFQSESKMGTIDRNTINVDVAFGTPEHVTVMVNSRVEDVLKVGLITIDKEGTHCNLITAEDLGKLTRKASYVREINPGANRKAFSPFNAEPGYKFGFSESFEVQGLNRLNNGDICIWGQMLYEVDNPNVPAGTSSLDVPKLKYYAEFICLRYNSALEMQQQYVHNLPPIAKPVHFDLISSDEQNLRFLIPVASDQSAASVLSLQTFMNGESKVVHYPAANLFIPEVFTINLTSNETSANAKTGYYMLNPKTGYQYNEVSNTLFVPCFTSNDPSKMQLLTFSL